MEGYSVQLKSKIFHLLFPPLNFIGRKSELEEVDALSKKSNKVVITGLGGSGKTALALKYAEQFQNQFQFIHLIQAGEKTSIVLGLMQLAQELGVREAKTEERLLYLQSHLQKQERRFLLIFDGVDHPDLIKYLKDILPNRGNHLFLFTSRISKADSELGFKSIKLSHMKFNEAIEYLFTESETPKTTSFFFSTKFSQFW